MIDQKAYNLPSTYLGAFKLWNACHPEYHRTADDRIVHLPTDTRWEKEVFKIDPSVEEWRSIVEHPKHYTWLPVEAIEITERFDFLVGNALKYLIRHQHKGKPLEDLRKARFYIDRAIKNLEGEQGNG